LVSGGRHNRKGEPNAKGKDLVVVESPSNMGIDVERGFQPTYVTPDDMASSLEQIVRMGNEANKIFIATDPDREGEAIAWHIMEVMGWWLRSIPPKRIVFHEITKEAVEEAFKAPREIDMQLVNAQQARRILDRLVGYQISPLLWRRVQRGTSAGRVQSVSLRMLVDREREIEAFIPVESWAIDDLLSKAGAEDIERNQFSATLHSVIRGSGTK
jgi:DNA topoisomerase-1